MIVLVDNYDSFSFNLFQLFGKEDPNIVVVRNDDVTVESLASLKPDGIVLSPGPGRPEQAGICEDAVRRLSGKVPILGVCLGHQAICEAFEGTIVHAARLVHGKASEIKIDTSSLLFAGIPERTTVARYHSLSVQASTLPACLQVTAMTVDAEAEIMAVQHREHPTFGVQFHPESILTPDGPCIARNFLSICRRWRTAIASI